MNSPASSDNDGNRETPSDRGLTKSGFNNQDTIDVIPVPEATMPPDHDPGETIDPRATMDATSEPANEEEFDPYSTDFGTLQTQEDVAETAAICERFQADSSGETLPTLEDYIPVHFTGQSRAALIQRLIVLEFSELRKRNQTIETREYLSRFPEHRSAVQSAFRSLDAASGQDTLLLPGTSPSGSASGSPKSVTKSNGTVRTLSAIDSIDRQGSRFQPLKLHARGGLGAVYLAKDAELGRMVALKEIQPKHSRDRSSQDRFVAEAVVTGALEHPGIVPVYGLGRYQDGRPYYAMRFIKGTSFQEAIAEFHKNHPGRLASDYYSRPFKALLRTFTDLCSAMFYAHEHGVLHRDIKPDNVMSGKFGETMVVDWGLAKVMGDGNMQTPTEHENQSLRSLDIIDKSGCVMGTPAFMSPEQASGKNDNLTAATDIYSLGATLFNVLTGERSIDGQTSLEVVLNVRKGNIRRIEEISPNAPLALASICYKAMNLSPSDRYQTAGQMVDDVDRWLADDLVLAHQHAESHRERFGRLIRRHHTWAVSGVIFFAAFTVLATLAVLLINRSRQLELIAKNEAKEFKTEAIGRYRESRSAIDTWLVGSNEALQFYPGTQSIRKRMLQLASEDYERLSASSSRDPDLELERARALIRLGDIHQIQQQYDDARSRYSAAITLLSDLHAPEPINALVIIEKANARARSGVSFFQEDKLTEASTELAAAVGELELFLSTYPQHPTGSHYLAAALVNTGELRIRQGDFASAISSLEKSIAIYSKSRSDDTSSHSEKLLREALLGEVRGSELLGRAFEATGRYRDADRVLTAAIDQLTKQLSLHPNDPDLADAIASANVSLASAVRTQGLQARLEESLDAAIDQYRSLRIAMPDVPQYTENLALTLTDLGIANQDNGQSIAAKSQLSEASELWQGLLELYGEVPRFHEESAACEDAFAQVVLDASDDAAAAMVHAGAAVQTYQELTELFPETPDYLHRLAVARSHAAIIQLRLNQPDNAFLLFEVARIGLRNLVTNQPDVPTYQNALAHLLNHEGTALVDSDKLEDGTAAINEAIAIWTKLAETGHAEAGYDLATVLLTCPIIEIRDHVSALRFIKRSTESSAQNPRYKSIYAIASALNNDFTASQRLLDEIIAEQGKWVGRDYFALAMLSRLTADGKADEWFSKGDDWLQANQPGNQTLQRIRNLAQELSAK